MSNLVKITKDNFHLVQSGIQISVSLGSLYTHTLKEKSKSHKDYWLLAGGEWVQSAFSRSMTEYDYENEHGFKAEGDFLGYL